MPDLAAPAAPAAPSAPAPAAPSTPAPAAPAVPVAPAPPAAPATPAAPAAPVAPAVPVKYNPETADAPPKSSDYPDNPQGMADFIKDNTTWGQSHETEAAKIRDAKNAAEDGQPAEISPEAAVAAEVAKVEGSEVDAPKPPSSEPVAAATPAAIEEWTSKSPELKAAFDKSPELKAAVMEMARGYEGAKAVLEIVGTPEEATFAVEHANRLVNLQANWMLGADDPEMAGAAWEQTVEMFKERDANGAEIKGADGKPKLGADFKPFVRKAASTALEDFSIQEDAAIATLKSRLAGNYPSDEAREADQELLDDAEYAKAALKYVTKRLSGSDDVASKLPALPPNATPEQIEFQKQLQAQAQELAAKSGQQSASDRKSARAAVNKEVQRDYEIGINNYIDTQVAAMKERGEYLPDFVLNDKWINPQTAQPTKVSAFGARVYLALNAKINGNPTHAAKLASLEALGAAGKDARKAEINRLQTLYLPKIFNAEVTRIQDGIRSTNKPKPPGTVDNGNNAGKPRVEPNSQGTVVPSAMDTTQIRAWAETEAKKDPGWSAMSAPDREALIISKGMRKKFGG